MELNLQNIEEAIFLDKKAQALFPEFRSHFDQWSLSKRVPGLQSMGKRMLIEVLNALDGEHLRKLEEYLSQPIILDKIDNSLVREYDGNIESAEDVLCQFAGFKEFCVHRNGNKLSVTFWR